MREGLLWFGDTARFRGIGKPLAVTRDLSTISGVGLHLQTPEAKIAVRSALPCNTRLTERVSRIILDFRRSSFPERGIDEQLLCKARCQCFRLGLPRTVLSRPVWR
jgi:hypothetical protein